MIVFNALAIPIVLLVGAIGAGLIWLAPGVFGAPYEEVTYSVLAIGIGGLGELVGLRGRLFFLPIWLIGGAVLAWQLSVLFGPTGLAVGGGLFGALMLAFVGTLVVMISGQEKHKGKRLQDARAELAKGAIEAAKTALADAWVIPAFGKTEAVRARHLLEVLALLDEHPSVLAMSHDGQLLARGVRRVLERIASGGPPVPFTSDEALLLHEMGKVFYATTPFVLSDTVREALAKIG